MGDVLLLGLLTFVASAMGTSTGFGTSTIMMPVLSLFLPVQTALLFVGIIHLCGDIWKVILFRTGIDWTLLLGFGVAGILASFLGASFSVGVSNLPLKQILGVFLLVYVAYLFIKRDWALPESQTTAVCGGLLSGFSAGFFGVGGAIRGAFLTAFNLPKDVYVFTSGLIALFIDITRVSKYAWRGIELGEALVFSLAICIPISFGGAIWAKKFLAHIPQKYFRFFIGVFLAIVGVILLTKA